MKPKFVRCKNNSNGQEHIRIGGIYEVESEYRSRWHVVRYVLKGIPHNWFDWRFEVVECCGAKGCINPKHRTGR